MAKGNNMRWQRKTACVACALLLALFVPSTFAHAADESVVVEGKGSVEADVDIKAEVVREPENVISVVVPSSVSIAVKTNVINGKFIGFDSEPSTITNDEKSSASVKIELMGVADGTAGSHKLLDYASVSLVGEYTVALLEGQNQQKPVFDSIAPGQTKNLSVSLVPKSSSTLMPNGKYALGSTLRVVAL